MYLLLVLCSDHIQINGVSVSLKTIKYKGRKEVRPSLMIFFQDENLSQAHKPEEEESSSAIEQLPSLEVHNSLLAQKVISAVNASTQLSQYVCEEDPHWLKFFSHRSELVENTALLADRPVKKVTDKPNGTCLFENGHVSVSKTDSHQNGRMPDFQPNHLS